VGARERADARRIVACGERSDDRAALYVVDEQLSSEVTTFLATGLAKESVKLGARSIALCQPPGPGAT